MLLRSVLPSGCCPCAACVVALGHPQKQFRIAAARQTERLARASVAAARYSTWLCGTRGSSAHGGGKDSPAAWTITAQGCSSHSKASAISDGQDDSVRRDVVRRGEGSSCRNRNTLKERSALLPPMLPLLLLLLLLLLMLLLLHTHTLQNETNDEPPQRGILPDCTNEIRIPLPSLFAVAHTTTCSPPCHPRRFYPAIQSC